MAEVYILAILQQAHRIIEAVVIADSTANKEFAVEKWSQAADDARILAQFCEDRCIAREKGAD